MRLPESFKNQSSSVQSLSHVWLFVTPWIAACQASLSITNPWSLLKLKPIESVMPSSHLILCRPLLLLPPVHPSIRVFSNESTLRMRWPKYWSSSFSISPSKEHPGLISFRMHCLDLLAVQGTLTLKNTSDKMTLIPSSFSCVVVPVWFCNWDRLFPSGEGGYLSALFPTDSLPNHSSPKATAFPKTRFFESGVSICPTIYITSFQVRS